MRSQLTRLVFRRLLNNQPVTAHRPLRRGIRLAAGSYSHQNGRITTLHPQQRRHFLNLFQKPKRDIRNPLLDPGMETMLDLERRKHLIARLPSPQQLARAFNSFIKSREQKSLPVEDFHALRLLQTLQTLEEQVAGDDHDITEMPLSRDDLSRALHVVSTKCSSFTQSHQELARALYTHLKNIPPSESEEGLQLAVDELLYVNNVLVHTGHTADAEKQLIDSFTTSSAHRASSESGWDEILEGYTRENNGAAIDTLLKTMDEMSVDLTPAMKRTLAQFYARNNNIAETKKWFASPDLFDAINQRPGQPRIISECLRTIMEFALRNKEMAWVQDLIEDATWTQSLQKEENMWSAVIMAAAASGKGVDELDQMIKVMVRRSEESGSAQKPGADLFNDLIEFAIARQQPYMAERFFGLLQKWNATPNARTFILQIEYRLAAEDYNGAQSSYDALREQSIAENEDWNIMNKLLQVLTTAPSVDPAVIMGLAEDIIDRRKLFPAETVRALCSYHLKRDEFFEVVDLLQTYAFLYSIEERCAIRDLLASVALNPKNDSGRCWDTYMILHQVFNIETKRDIRNKIMAEMFRRGRPDLATHVFTRMSKNSRADTRPDKSTYVAAFYGIYQTQEPEALEVIHNLLKLDTEVEPDTQLRNSLMLAYIGVDMPWRSVEYWDQISTSDEGPTYESLNIVLRASERVGSGQRVAKEVWDRLRAADIDINRDLAANYIGALAGNSIFDETCKVILRLKDETGVQPDAQILGTFFNACLGFTLQDKVEAFIQENYPEVWTEMEKRGITENEVGLRMIHGIDRTLHP